MIEVSGLSKSYKTGNIEVIALREVSFKIESGEYISIMGPSGSGKSTLMNILGCIDTPTSGSYRLDGQEVSTLDDEGLATIRNQKVGFVFQIFNLLPRLTALANVELPLIYSGAYRKRGLVLEALQRVGLAGRAKHKPAELSGGEQQRVAIARALINKPPVILADEPTGNLDSASAGEILSIFRKLNEDGITVVMVTHEVDIAAQCERIIRMRDGAIASDEVVTHE